MWRKVRNTIARSAAAVRNFTDVRPFPLPAALTGYSAMAAAADARSGLNVALLAFPQGMAYAAIAGLPIQYGIFGSAVAAILGPIFSGSRFIMLGPTNATAVLLFAAFLGISFNSPAEHLAAVSLVVFLAGLFLVAGSLIKIASLIQYVSRSVVAGYITAAALFIVLNQSSKALGFSFKLPNGATFLTVCQQTLLHLPDTHWPSLVLALLTFAIYQLLQQRWKLLPNVAITLVLTSLLGYGFNSWLNTQNNIAPLTTLAALDASQWRLNLPPLRPDLISQFAGIALVLAFLSVLEGISIGKSLASRSGQRLNVNQEMFGMGIANIGCGLLQGMPASGSLTRSQLNWASGAASPLASIISGVIIIAGAFAIGGFTHFIPVSALAVLVILIGISLINRHVIRVVWNATRSDRAVFLTTFAAALLVRLDIAIILGAALSILLFLRKAAQPEFTEFTENDEPATTQGANPEISIVHVEGELFFGAAELFRDQLRRVCERPNLRIVILKMRYAYHLDATSVLALEELVRFMQADHRHLLITEARPDALRVLRNSGLADLLGDNAIYPDDPANPTLATARALKFASSLLKGHEPEVRIFLGQSRKSAP